MSAFDFLSLLGQALASLLAPVSAALLDFVFFYPLFMSWLWMTGAVYYWFHWEKDAAGPDDAPAFADPPLVSILVPCFNEGENVAETIAGVAAQTYPNFEIIAINDGSKDDTGAHLDALLEIHPNLRVVHFARNQGKAMGLRMGALVARGEFLVCIDGDAILHPNATSWLVKHFINGPRVGAVTGNPRIRNRSTLLGRIQVGEFSSIIGLIKRSQRVYGSIFTVSGVIAAFRKAALHSSGYWSLDMITEDIDVSWMLELKHWAIRYEPNALCWILMPETYSGLWKQRLRWAQGGAEVFLKYAKRVWRWKHRRMWAVILEYAASIVWAYAFLWTLVLYLLGKLVPLPAGLNVPTIGPPSFWGLVLATTYLFQSVVAFTIERRYDQGLYRGLFWMVWYPFAFWAVSLFTSIVGFAKAVTRRRGGRALWTSPDRGFRAPGRVLPAATAAAFTSLETSHSRPPHH